MFQTAKDEISLYQISDASNQPACTQILRDCCYQPKRLPGGSWAEEPWELTIESEIVRQAGAFRHELSSQYGRNSLLK